MLQTAATSPVASGGAMDGAGHAVTVALSPFPDAPLPREPERRPASTGGFAGYLTVSAITPGLYRVTIPVEAWVDVIQNGAFVTPAATTTARGCTGLHKSLAFNLANGDITIQFSSVEGSRIAVAITRATGRRDQ